MTPLQLRTAGFSVVMVLFCSGISFAQGREDDATRSEQLATADFLHAVNPADSPHSLLPLSDSIPSASPRSSLSLSDSSLYRDLPSISGELSVNGTKLMPYVGAGFGNGYASDLDRALNQGTAVQPDTSNGNPLGPNMTPNEVRMGIRIPF
ncbi:hypothetical protein YTPLAS18_19450 [Nitrospira sp.]|nr:hypothetical protein YTPLAS18_19450 [Nitrospira sp.]